MKHRGFTLMEVMVAVSIFAIVVTIGIGSLLVINNSYRQAQTSRQAIDSLTYILESLSRSLRTAQEWYPTNTPYSITFKDQDGKEMNYTIDNQVITMENRTDNEGPYVITPMSVQIDPASMFTEVPAINGFKYMQINIAGKVTYGKQISNFAFQTGVSKRSPDQP